MIKIINPVFPITEGRYLAVIFQKNFYCLIEINDQKNSPSKINEGEVLFLAIAPFLTEDATIEQTKLILKLIALDNSNDNDLIVHVCNSKKEAQSKIQHLQKN